MTGPGKVAAVFSEPTGQRWQRVRAGAIVAGALSILVVVGLIAAALLPPVLPQAGAFNPAGEARPAPLSRRAAAEHDAARERLYRALRRGQKLPAATNASSQPRAGPAAPDSLVAGFYVDWAEQSYESLREHLDHLDWVIAEWAFISKSGDTLRLSHDHKILQLIDQVPRARRPKVLLMVSNVIDGSAGRFGGVNSERLLADPVIRRRAAERLAREVHDFGLAGVTVDFEDVPDSSLPLLGAFLDDLRAALGPGPLLTQTIQDYLPPEWARRFAQKCDMVILMLYDEHYDKNDPGPIAGRGWFTEQLDSMMAVLPPAKVMVGIGAYGGYDWNDAGDAAQLEQVTVPDIWHLSREKHVLPQFDTDVFQPYLAWTGADSVDHFIWYEDATTAADEMRIARRYGVTSVGLWRLGSEDPSVWRLFTRRAQLPPLGVLDTIEPAYNVNFEGNGDLLTVREQPYPGARHVTTNAAGVLTNVVTDSVPGEWVVSRMGHHPGEVALTFDDGPDPRWTPAILDTLRSRHVHATFFMIGDEVASHYSLTRRVLREGNEIGNHTFTHPNLAVTSPWWTRLQLDATNRLFEAILGRRTILLRTPYLGDNDPSTPDELVPIAIASKLGYITAGVSVDGEDWQPRTTANEIVLNVLEGRDQAEARDAGDLVLLHDGGGDRARTVAVLGRLIDSLHARGDTIVTVGQIGGLPLDVVMPPVTGRSSYTRLLELAMFGAFSVLELGFYWAFFAAIVLGMVRLIIILALAAIQRFHRRRFVSDHSPGVSVVIPAFREETVIVPTVKSLLAQDYEGTLEILVIDDGSPDDTFGVAQRAFADEPRVRVLTKPNGGKASALNFGIEHAAGEIIVALDADTLFDPDTVRHLVTPLADPHVGAVAGNAKVGNRINLVTRWQALEYVTSQNLDRRAFALLDCIMVVPGAIGAWRKSLVLEVGGFSHDTLAEDQDLTLSIGRRGYRVAYADDAIAWTEAPDTLSALAKQRFRWSFGTLQCAWKHRDLLFRREAGTLGFIALPNVWVFQLFFSFIAPAADLVFVFSLIGVFMMYHEHNTTYAIASLNKVVVWYAIFIAVDWCAATLAFLMEPDEDRRLTWLVFLQRFVYRQIMYWVVLRSVLAALRGGLVGWGKLERKATVELRAS